MASRKPHSHYYIIFSIGNTKIELAPASFNCSIVSQNRIFSGSLRALLPELYHWLAGKMVGFSTPGKSAVIFQDFFFPERGAQYIYFLPPAVHLEYRVSSLIHQKSLFS